MSDWVYEINDIKTDAANLLLNETLFHNANGYIGVRSCFEESYSEGITGIRGSYINGFYDFIPMPQAEKLYGLTEEKQIMLNVADIQGIQLFFDDEEFSMWSGTVLESRRRLYMKEGYTERFIRWRSPKGKEAEICIRRMASFVRSSLFLISYSVKALNFSGQLRFVSTHSGDVGNFSDPTDPRLAAEPLRRLSVIDAALQGNASFITAETLQSKLQVCTAVTHNVWQDEKNSSSVLSDADIHTVLENNAACCTINVPIQERESINLYKYAIFADSIRHGDCVQKIKDEIAALTSVHPKTLFEEQQKHLEHFWDNAFFEIEGDEKLNLAVRYNLYQLNQSAGRDTYGAVAAKGLSGEGYEGHFFWDTEIYAEPFFVLTNPDLARNLISFRYSTLEEARKNARLLGHKKGALFPWRTIMGKECSGFFPAGTAQYHINGDIARSVVFYYLATGDINFIIEKGAELVFECARLWIDAGNYHLGKFVINNVTGPDEYTCVVNNNYYTNICARQNLLWAVTFYELLKNENKQESICEKIALTQDEIQAFAEAAEKMYIPYDEKTGINPQDDSFLSKTRLPLAEIPPNHFPLLLHYHPLFLYRHQVCKQADTILAYSIFGNEEPLEIEMNSFLYYEDITTHDSSLSECIFCIVASKLGFYEDAYHYFGNSAMLDLSNVAGNSRDGLHIANMGGTYMSILFGFAGLRITESGVSFAPHLPDCWKALRFKLCYKGSRIAVEIDSRGIHFELLAGAHVPLLVYGTSYELIDSQNIPLQNADNMGIRKYKSVIFNGNVLADEIGTSSILKHLKSMGITIAVLGNDDLNKGNPNPEAFLKIAKDLHVSIGDTLIVTDTLSGIEAASAGGFDSAALGDARNSPHAVYKLDRIAGLFYSIIPTA